MRCIKTGFQFYLMVNPSQNEAMQLNGDLFLMDDFLSMQIRGIFFRTPTVVQATLPLPTVRGFLSPRAHSRYCDSAEGVTIAFTPESLVDLKKWEPELVSRLVAAGLVEAAKEPA